MMSRTMDFERPVARHAAPDGGAVCPRSRCAPSVDATCLAAANPMAAACAPRPADTSMTVLLADDSAVLRIVLSMMLESLGMRVVLAEDGMEALQRIEEHAVDIVLMDLDMPIVDGLESARRIRAREARLRLAPVPILSISGATSPEDRHRCLAAGMNDVLGKPFTCEALALRLRWWGLKMGNEMAPLDFGDVGTPLNNAFERA